MAATLKVSDEAKASLDRLQATLTLALDHKPTLGELVDNILALAWEQRGELLGRMSGWRPATPEEIAALEAHIHALNEQARNAPPGPPMSEEDRVLYGGDGEP